MEPTNLDSSLVNWLFDFMANLEMMRQKQHMRLNQFYETALKVLYIETGTNPKLVSPSESISLYNSRVLYFVEKEMRKIRRSHLEKSMQLTLKLMGLIKDPKFAIQKVDIIVDEDKFFTEMITDPPNYRRLKVFSNTLFNKCIFKNEDFEEKLLKLLNNACLQVDKTSYYFRESSIQEKFDDIIFMKNCPLFEVVDNFLTVFSDIPRRSFTSKVSDIFYFLISIMNQELDPILSSCCFIFLIRSLFSHAYAINPDYFYPPFDCSKKNYIKSIASEVPCSYFAISDEFLPPHKPDDKMIDVFSKNKFYLMGTFHLQFSAMVLNPIDAIYEIHEMMICNHRGAEIEINDPNVSVFPFETTFGLFIASILASDLPNFEQVAPFISDFAPQTGLCPEFEFVSTTIRAASAFCVSLHQCFSK